MGERSGGQRQNFTSQFVVDAPGAARVPVAVEADPHRIAQRQKQIDYGKNTLGYQRYTEEVPRNLRRKMTTKILKHPDTPDVTQICSKRSFDGQAKKWRRELHLWDPDDNEDLIEPVMQGPQNPESPPTSPDASLTSDCEVHAPAHALPTVPVLEYPGSSSFVSPKKQRTDSGYAVPQYPLPPRHNASSAGEATAAGDVPRKPLSTGSKRSYQDMDTGAVNSGLGPHSNSHAAATPTEPNQEPEEELAPWDDDAAEVSDTTAALVDTAKPADDIFGPAHEFD